MENRTTILNELREKNPYEVPVGYFEGLADQVLNRVKDIEVPLSDSLQKATQNPYQLPQGYFDNLPAAILNRVKADNAVNADEELEMLSPLLKQIGRKNPFSVPEGYFELEPGSPLQGLQPIQVYEVPENYFAQLPGQLLNKVKPAAKVVSMRRRFIQYAAAAVVTGLLFTAGWMYFGNQPTKGTGIPPTVAAKLDKVSDEVLENYMANEALIPVDASITASNDIDMKVMLAEIPDEDLQLYLEKYNTSKDITTN